MTLGVYISFIDTRSHYTIIVCSGYAYINSILQQLSLRKDYDCGFLTACCGPFSCQCSEVIMLLLLPRRNHFAFRWLRFVRFIVSGDCLVIFVSRLRVWQAVFASSRALPHTAGSARTLITIRLIIGARWFVGWWYNRGHSDGNVV